MIKIFLLFISLFGYLNAMEQEDFPTNPSSSLSSFVKAGQTPEIDEKEIKLMKSGYSKEEIMKISAISTAIKLGMAPSIYQDLEEF